MTPNTKSHPRLKRQSRPANGFTLVELLVVITSIIVLAALSFKGYGAIRQRAQLSTCAGNLRLWGVVIQSYAGDHNGAVQWKNWASINNNDRYFETYLGGDGVNASGTMNNMRVLLTQAHRHCPAQRWDGKGNGPVGYAMTRPNPKVSNTGSYNLSTASNPSQLLMMIDASALTLGGPAELATAVQPLCSGPNERHSAKVNALFGDGHIAAYNAGDLSGKDSEKQAMLERWFTLK